MEYVATSSLPEEVKPVKTPEKAKPKKESTETFEQLYDKYTPKSSWVHSINVEQLLYKANEDDYFKKVTITEEIFGIIIDHWYRYEESTAIHGDEKPLDFYTIKKIIQNALKGYPNSDLFNEERVKIGIKEYLGLDTTEDKAKRNSEIIKKREEELIKKHNDPINKEISKRENEVKDIKEDFSKNTTRKECLIKSIDALKISFSEKEELEDYGHDFLSIDSNGFTESYLMGMKAKDLEVILRDFYGIEPDDFDGKNTNRKLRTLVLEAQKIPSDKVKEYLDQFRVKLKKELEDNESELAKVDAEIERLGNILKKQGTEIANLKDQLMDIKGESGDSYYDSEM